MHIGWAWRLDALGSVAAAALAAGGAPAAAQPLAAPPAAPSGPAQWIERLRSGDFAQRLAASYDYSAVAVPSPQTLDLLIAALKDPDPRVREHVAAALGEIDGASAPRVAALIGTLKDSDAAVRSQATLALGKLGEPAANALVDALLDDAQLREPTTAAVLWEDYAFAALARAEESAAPSFARALVTLTERKMRMDVAADARAAAAPDEHDAPRVAYPFRPGLTGDELKLALFDEWKSQLGPLGRRALADELLGAARLRPMLRVELERLAGESLRFASTSNLIDPDPQRAARLADFLAVPSAGQISYRDGALGDVSLLLLDRLVAAGRDKEAQTLLSGIEVSGPLAEQWVGRLEPQLRSGSPEYRQAAIVWLERHRDSAIPVSEKLLWKLIKGSDRGQAAVAAGYLAGLDDRSPELLAALADIGTDPTASKEAARNALEAIERFGPDALAIEDKLAAAARISRGEGYRGAQCKAATLLRTLHAQSSATVDALLTASSRTGCASEAVPALLALGKTPAEIVDGARQRSAAAEAPDAAFIASFAEGPRNRDDDDASVTPLPDITPVPLAAGEVLDQLRTKGTLSNRNASGLQIRTGGVRPYAYVSSGQFDDTIRTIEAAAPEQFDQRNPLFGALADLRIFDEIQKAVETAADWRFEYAFPQQPSYAAAARGNDFVRQLPKWPWSWPPPKYSAWGVVDGALIPANSTIGSVYGRLSRILEYNGYGDNRLYGVKSGVAVVTHLEQTGPGGETLPTAQRWSYNPQRLGQISFARYVTDAFMGIREHYRLFAFFLINEANISGGTGVLTYEEAKNPKVDGARVLPPEIAKIPWTGFYLHSLIYRYKKVNGTVTPITADVPSAVQLKKAGITFSLQRRS
jgi:hypothetical protein